MTPFEQGQNAFRKGELTNPFKLGTNNYRNWEHGFNKAYYKAYYETLNKQSLKEEVYRGGSEGVSTKEKSPI